MLKEEKASIRKSFLEKRLNADSEILLNKSFQISKTLANLPLYKDAKVILVYLAIKNEVNLIHLIEEASSKGKILCIPRVNKQNKELELYKICNIQSDTCIGSYGIYEPIINLKNKIDPKQVELAIIPGIGFDIKGNRIGFGQGYYDKLLAKLKPDAFKIGAAFEFQVCEKIPNEEFDVKMDMVVTEERIIYECL